MFNYAVEQAVGYSYAVWAAVSVEGCSTHDHAGFAQAGKGKWNHWRWQMTDRIRTVAHERCMFALRQESGLKEVAEKHPLAITPYYALLIQTPDERDPVSAQASAMVQGDMAVGSAVAISLTRAPMGARS